MKAIQSVWIGPNQIGFLYTEKEIYEWNRNMYSINSVGWKYWNEIVTTKGEE